MRLSNQLIKAVPILVILLLAIFVSVTASTDTPVAITATPITGGTSFGGAAIITPGIEYISTFTSTKRTYAFDVQPGQLATLYVTTTTNFGDNDFATFYFYDQDHVNALTNSQLNGPEQPAKFIYLGNNSTPTRYFLQTDALFDPTKEFLLQVILTDQQDGLAIGDAGDTAETARIINAPPNVTTIFTGTASGDDLDDWYRIDVPPGAQISTTITILDRGDSNDLVYTYLYDNADAGQYLISDTGNSNRSQFTFQGNSNNPTAYLLQMHLIRIFYGIGKPLRYNVKVQVTPQSDAANNIDAGETASSAMLITPTLNSFTSYEGRVGGTDQNDWFRVPVPLGSQISATVTILDRGDFEGVVSANLYDGADTNTQLDSQSLWQADVAHFIYMGNSAAPSSYLLQMDMDLVQTGRPVKYRIDLLITPQSDANISDDAGDVPASARLISPTLNSLTVFTGTTGGVDAIDWYRINVASGQRISTTVSILDFGDNDGGLVNLLDADKSASALQTLTYQKPAGNAKSMIYMSNNTTPSAYFLEMDMDTTSGGLPLVYQVVISTTQQADATFAGDAGDSFDTAREISPTLIAPSNRLGSADNEDFYLFNLPIDPNSPDSLLTPYSLIIAPTFWPQGSSGSLAIQLYNPNRSTRGAEIVVQAPTTDIAFIDLTGCDLCYAKVTDRSAGTTELEYKFSLLEPSRIFLPLVTK